MRRVVYTKDLIVFADVGQEVVLDVIPMAEIISVRAIDTEQVPDQSVPGLGRYGLTAMVAFAILGALAMTLWNLRLVAPLWPAQPQFAPKPQFASLNRRSRKYTSVDT